MLEVMGLVLTGAEVKKNNNRIPRGVNINIAITKIEETDEENVAMDFKYEIDYRPRVAYVKITGRAYCIDAPDNIKKLMVAFKKRKELPLELGANVINMINADAGVNSIFLIRPFNLVPPFMPPFISGEKRKKQEEMGRRSRSRS